MPKSNDMCQVLCVDHAKVDRIRVGILPTSELAVSFKALADETRLKVALALSQEEMCVCEVADVLDTTVQNASHHLRHLRKAGMATFRKEGKLVFYQLVPEVLFLIQAMIAWREGAYANGEPCIAG